MFWVRALPLSLAASPWLFPQTWENVELYRYYREQYFSQPRAGATGPLGAPAYPWATVFLVAPAALACALGKRTRVAAGILTVDMLKEDTQMIYLGLKALIKDGMRPNELMVKKLSMFGCIALVFANAVRDPRGGSAMVGGVAGMLTDDTRPQLASRRKSALLLAGRLLMAALFVYVGSGQMARIRTRSQSWQHRVDPTDGHDNSWLILELVLSLPFAAGYKTRPVTLALAATLAAEALTCWRFWHYRADAARGAWALVRSRYGYRGTLVLVLTSAILQPARASSYTAGHTSSQTSRWREASSCWRCVARGSCLRCLLLTFARCGCRAWALGATQLTTWCPRSENKRRYVPLLGHQADRPKRSRLQTRAGIGLAVLMAPCEQSPRGFGGAALTTC